MGSGTGATGESVARGARVTVRRTSASPNAFWRSTKIGTIVILPRLAGASGLAARRFNERNGAGPKGRGQRQTIYGSGRVGNHYLRCAVRLAFPALKPAIDGQRSHVLMRGDSKSSSGALLMQKSLSLEVSPIDLPYSRCRSQGRSSSGVLMSSGTWKSRAAPLEACKPRGNPLRFL